MIYIISSSLDMATSEVINWLYCLKKEYKRVNDLLDYEETIKVCIDNEGKRLKDKNHGLSNNDNSVWFRKGEDYAFFDSEISKHYRKENSALIDFLFTANSSTKIIGKQFYIVNKLSMLNKAKTYGLAIPDTIITNSKIVLQKFEEKNITIISKPISEIFVTGKGRNQKVTYTKVISSKIIKSLPNKFHTSLFQQCIQKEFDIRVFYFDKVLYPMTIFSQNEKKTSIDFRNYNFTKPNRTVPYRLPVNIEESLIKFMREEKMEGASIDMIKCKTTGKYYFLEVNPWGQFGMVSYPCNYYIEKKIAEIL